MVKHTLKILQQILQDFLNVFDHFDTLCVNSLNQRLLGLSSFPSPVIWTRTPIFNTSIKYQFILPETFRWLLLGKHLTNWHEIWEAIKLLTKEEIFKQQFAEVNPMRYCSSDAAYWFYRNTLQKKKQTQR